MKPPKLEWRDFKGTYVAGENLMAGKIKLADAAHNGLRARGDPNAYVGNIFLPGLKVTEFRGIDIEVLKAEIEKAVRAWFEALA